MADKPVTPKAAPAGQYQGVPTIYFPQYSMYDPNNNWANLPPPGQANFNNQTGMWAPYTAPVPPATGGGMIGGGTPTPTRIPRTRTGGLLSSYTPWYNTNAAQGH